MGKTERITESAIEAIKKEIGQEKISYEHVYHLEHDYKLVAVVSKEPVVSKDSDYPGRALGFTCSKRECKPQLLAFPSKSVGLFGGGLIFRSDFSGEDLAAYAGAGIYSSIMLPQPHKVLLDYTDEKLVWDDDFRLGFLTAIDRIGAIVEDVLMSHQDIEGVYSKEQYYVVQARHQVGIESRE